MNKYLAIIPLVIALTQHYKYLQAACCGQADPAPAQTAVTRPQVHASQQNNLELNKPLNRAKRIFKRFYLVLKRYQKKQELTNFIEYLKYYKSEGGYQAVTPAPHKLRTNLSAHSLNLFDKIKKLAQVYTVSPKPIPGVSKLSLEGEKFYQELIKHVDELLKSF